jgi:hypothetical protein
MAQSPTSTTAENSSAPTEAADETLIEVFMKEISGNPRFQEAEKSGKAFVIGGTKLPKTR